MKKINNVLFYFVTSLILLVSLIMLIIEMRLLISGDFLLCDNEFNAFIRYFLRTLIAVGFMSVAVIEIFQIAKKCQFLEKNLYFVEFLLLIVSIVILIYGTNYVGIVCFVLTGLFLSLKTIKIMK